MSNPITSLNHSTNRWEDDEWHGNGWESRRWLSKTEAAAAACSGFITMGCPLGVAPGN